MADTLAAKNKKEIDFNFASIKNKLDYPDFLEVYNSNHFKDFFQLDTSPENRHDEGLFKVFSENFPDHRCAKSVCS